MRKKLAIKGGKKVVPDNLKVKWPIITREDKEAVMAVLDRGTVWGLMPRKLWDFKRNLLAILEPNTV